MPKEIAGVVRSKEMTNEEADGGAPNPNFAQGDGYRSNCQSCVVCYEMRKRGYDVTTMPNTKYSALHELSRNYKDAWLDMETGESPKGIQLLGGNTKKVLANLDGEVQEGNRYTLRLKWKECSYGHVVNVFRENGTVTLYDPQSGKRYTGNEMMEYISQAKMKGKYPPELLRIDNLALNPKYMNKIVKKA